MGLLPFLAYRMAQGSLMGVERPHASVPSLKNASKVLTLGGPAISLHLDWILEPIPKSFFGGVPRPYRGQGSGACPRRGDSRIALQRRRDVPPTQKPLPLSLAEGEGDTGAVLSLPVLSGAEGSKGGEGFGIASYIEVPGVVSRISGPGH